jgi:hypothetical protein
MMWGYAGLSDGTCLAHSGVLDGGAIEVAAERPTDSGFDEARCLLPTLSWFGVVGFTEQDMERLDAFVRRNAPLITRLAEEVRTGNVG